MNNLKNIANLYENYEMQIDDLCRQYDLPVDNILAIIAVETNDDDGFVNNELIIRFEAHKFIKYVKEITKDTALSHFRFNNKKPWRGQQVRFLGADIFTSYHGKQSREHAVFNLAKNIDIEAAYKSISMGLPQIMGFNHKQCGFDSAINMYGDFNHSTISQLRGMFEFFGITMRRYIRDGDFFNFAEMYNGKGKATDYAGRMIKAKSDINEYLEDQIG